ncbi:MAG: nucleoside hydrolase [Cyclobacteriaceae bacterium]|nr:nucleoside hydrolase [Cyclobacteriaceae bacterium]
MHWKIICKVLVIAMILLHYQLISIAQPKIILDTDIGSDADDLAAIAMLHNLHRRGECELLAIMCWSTEKYAVPAIDALNRYYGHPEIPVGARDIEVFYESWQYNKAIADRFEHQLKHDDVPNATTLYRKLLHAAEDQSIIVVTIGPLFNIQALIQSEPDSVSKFSGRDLIAQKVEKFVIMGGGFPDCEIDEWNFNGRMPGVTKFVIENLPVPIVFSGYEVGMPIMTGETLNQRDSRCPLFVGYQHFSKYAPWMQPYENRIKNNNSYDQTAVLYAVRGGVGKYWEKISDGHCAVNEAGRNTWIRGKKSLHSYLRLIETPEKVADVIESVMLNTF